MGVSIFYQKLGLRYRTNQDYKPLPQENANNEPTSKNSGLSKTLCYTILPKREFDLWRLININGDFRINRHSTPHED